MIRRSVPALAALGVLVAAAWPTGVAKASGIATVQRGIEFASPAGSPLLADVYSPQGNGPFPAVILVHGGGWQWGQRSNLESVAQYLADNGFVAITIDYRLANKKRKTYAPYPAAVNDVRSSIVWVRDHASQYHVDPRKLGLLGSSAGAHLASLVGMMGSGPLDQGDRVRAVVSWSGPQDMAEFYRDGSADARSAIEAFTNCTGGEAACAAILKKVSPLSYVDRTDPPLFFSNGTVELVTLPQAVEMDGALTRAGVPHQLVEVPGRLHAQHYSDKTAPSLPAGETVLQASLQWLKEWVAGSKIWTGRPSPTPGPSSAPGGSSGILSRTMIALVLAGGGILLFAVAAVGVSARRRSRRSRSRAERVREWKEGQVGSVSGRRHRGRSSSGGGSTSHDRGRRSRPGGGRDRSRTRGD